MVNTSKQEVIDSAEKGVKDLLGLDINIHIDESLVIECKQGADYAEKIAKVVIVMLESHDMLDGIEEATLKTHTADGEIEHSYIENLRGE
jgi:hypothetical protein